MHATTLNRYCENAAMRLALGLLVGLFLISQPHAAPPPVAPPPTKAPLALFLGHDRLAIVDANGELWRYGINGLPSMQKTGSGFVSVHSQYALHKNGQLDLPDSDLPWQGNQPDPKHGGLPAALQQRAMLRHVANDGSWNVVLFKNGQLWAQPVLRPGKFDNPDNPEPPPKWQMWAQQVNHFELDGDLWLLQAGQVQHWQFEGEEIKEKRVWPGRYRQIAADGAALAAIDEANHLWAMGAFAGQTLAAPQQLASRVVQVALNDKALVALHENGDLELWAAKESRLWQACPPRTGRFERVAPPIPAGPGAWQNRVLLQGIVRFALGNERLLYARSDGSIFTRGWYWEIDPGESQCEADVKVDLSDGLPLAWRPVIAKPHPGVAQVPGIKRIFAFGDSSAVWQTDGSLWLWGDNRHGQLAGHEAWSLPQPMRLAGRYRNVAVQAHRLVLENEAGVVQWWGSPWLRVGRKNITPVTLGEALHKAGPWRGWQGWAEEQLIGIKQDGSAWWLTVSLGSNQHPDSLHQIGRQVWQAADGCLLREDHSLWQGFALLQREVLQFVCGRSSYWLKQDGGLWGVGDNHFGQLGRGQRSDYEGQPQKILDQVQHIAKGKWHMLALQADGRLLAWGDNLNGALGIGGEPVQNRPAAVGSGFAMVAAGNFHTLAVKKDGSLWVWGANFSGQLGLPGPARNQPVRLMLGGPAGAAGAASGATTTNAASVASASSPPATVSPAKPGGSQVQTISVGENHACVLLKSGVVKCWGGNQHGQAGPSLAGPEGKGALVKPQEVPAANGARQLWAARNYTCALLPGPRPLCWGEVPHEARSLLEDQASFADPDLLYRLTQGVTRARSCRIWQNSGGYHCRHRCLAGNPSTNASTNKPGPDARACQQITERHPFLAGATEIVTDGNRWCALRPDRAIRCQDDRATPILVGSENSVQFDFSGRMGCSVLANDAVKCWGMPPEWQAEVLGLPPGAGVPEEPLLLPVPGLP